MTWQAVLETKKPGSLVGHGNLPDHMAVRSVPSQEAALAARPAPPASGHDFSHLPVRGNGGNLAETTCPLSPRTCPFGGACHTCPVHVQAKLKISQPDDEHEREADRVADAVMRMSEPKEEEQKKCPASGCVPVLQRRAIGWEMPEEAPPIVNEVLRSPGQPLDTATRASMKPRFGRDFAQVRVHSDMKAAESAEAVNALAYTMGRDIVFGAGRYAPDTQEGQRLLVHELTHVVQQGRTDHHNDTGTPTIIQRACQDFPNHSDPDTYCQTEDEARAAITRACPPYRNDFLYRDGPPTHRWRRIPGYGCAHHVAHILGIANGPSYARCRGGFSVTIDQITQGRTPHPLAEAQINDVWSTGVHSGVVTQVDTSVPRVRVNQCGTGGNAQTVWFNNGSVFR
jgi:hypothetical protein